MKRIEFCRNIIHITFYINDRDSSRMIYDRMIEIIYMCLILIQRKYAKEKGALKIASIIISISRRRFMYYRTADARAVFFHRAFRRCCATIDHNERIVTWINSPRGPENVFSRRGTNARRRSEDTIIRGDESETRVARREHFRWRLVYPRMTLSARDSSRFYSPPLPPTPSVYFKIARNRLPGLLRGVLLPCARDERYGNGSKSKRLTVPFEAVPPPPKKKQIWRNRILEKQKEYHLNIEEWQEWQRMI